MIQAKLRHMADIRLLVNRRENTPGTPTRGVVTDPNTVVKISVTETTYQPVDDNGNALAGQVADTSTSFTFSGQTQANDFVTQPSWETAWASNNYQKPENVAWAERNYEYGGAGLVDEGKLYPTTNLWVYGDIGIPKDNPVSVFLKGTVDPVLDQVVATAALAKTTLDVAGRVAGAFVNPANALIKAGVDAARTFLQNSLTIGVHSIILDVPYGFIGEYKAPNHGAVQRLANQMWPFTTPLTVDGLEVDTSQGGGVPGLLKLVEETLRDEGDDQRPVFPGATSYMGLTLAVGTDIPGDFGKVVEAMKKLGSLCALTFGTPLGNARSQASDPIARPTELKADRAGTGVILRWRDGVTEYPYYRTVNPATPVEEDWTYKRPPDEFKIWGSCDAAALKALPSSSDDTAAQPVTPTGWNIVATSASEEGALLLNAVDVVASAGSGIGIGNSAAPRYYSIVTKQQLEDLDRRANNKPGRGPYYFAVQHIYNNTVQVIPYTEPMRGSEGFTGTNVSVSLKPQVITESARVTYTPKPAAASNGVAPNWYGGSVSMSDAAWWDGTIGSLPSFLDAQLLRPLQDDLTDINDGLQNYIKQLGERLEGFEDIVSQVKSISSTIQELMNLRVGVYARAFQTVASPAQLDALYNDGNWTEALLGGVSTNPDGTIELTRPAPKTGLDALLQEYKESLGQLPFQKDTDFVGALFVVVPLPATPGAELEKIVTAWNTLMQVLGLAGQQLGQVGKDWEQWRIDWDKMYAPEPPGPDSNTVPMEGLDYRGPYTLPNPPIGEDDVWSRMFRPDTDCNCPPPVDYSRMALTDSFQLVRPSLASAGETLATINITHRFTRSR